MISVFNKMYFIPAGSLLTRLEVERVEAQPVRQIRRFMARTLDDKMGNRLSGIFAPYWWNSENRPNPWRLDR